MPLRAVSLSENEYYHVFNRGNNKQNIFSSSSDYRRMTEIIAFYIPVIPGIKFSRFKRLSPILQGDILENNLLKEKSVEIVSFCLMPNHFHLLIKQICPNGISRFMANVQNSYSHYINTKYQSVGHVFQGQFKAVHIDTIEQLLHVSRYIHLNPYSSDTVHSLGELFAYPWSSLKEFTEGKNGLCHKEIILDNISREKYKDFIVNQADYQQTLEIIKHQLIDPE